MAALAVAALLALGVGSFLFFRWLVNKISSAIEAFYE